MRDGDRRSAALLGLLTPTELAATAAADGRTLQEETFTGGSADLSHARAIGRAASVFTGRERRLYEALVDELVALRRDAETVAPLSAACIGAQSMAASARAGWTATDMLAQIVALMVEAVGSAEGGNDGAELQAAMTTVRELEGVAVSARNAAAVQLAALEALTQAMPGGTLATAVLQRAESLQARLGIDPLPAFQREMLAATVR